MNGGLARAGALGSRTVFAESWGKHIDQKGNGEGTALTLRELSI